MTLAQVGFFRELRHGHPNGPSLEEAVGKLHASDVGGILRYLENAPTLAATGSVVDDALSPDRTGVAKLEIATDGEWVWPRDLAYYVRQYDVGLPAEFIALIDSRAGLSPELDREALSRAAVEFLEGS